MSRIGKSIKTESRMGLREDRGPTASGYEAVVWGDENALKLSVVTAEQFCELYTLSG